MTTLFGQSRSVVTPQYALITPPGLVRAPLPGWPGAECCVVISPALGARFAQLLITLGEGALGLGEHADEEQLIYVLAGELDGLIGGMHVELGPGGYVYIPPHAAYRLRAAAAESPVSLLVFQRRYQVLSDIAPPGPLAGQEQEIPGAPFMGDEAAILKLLLPDIPAFDMAVNIFTFQPGATLPIVETHVMEHGLLMLQGQGIYRLGSDWHPVQADDMIWMAPFCPQWFVATGKTPARYIYYKDVNRRVL
jgi:(S)-ureidoglycine aminohydrolase